MARISDNILPFPPHGSAGERSHGNLGIRKVIFNMERQGAISGSAADAWQVACYGTDSGIEVDPALLARVTRGGDTRY